MNDNLYKIDVGKLPLFELHTPKCDNCAKVSGLLLYGWCQECIYRLIQAEKSKRPAARTTSEE